ncbi:MAG TPA: peptidyl-prolyl cis-trans isomerase [Terriglobales bacterium]|nr:peptidyl-prolyl cis-trans isomerase [Terriglobales bacterium]
MRKSWLLCVLLGAIAWGQAAPHPAQAPVPAKPADTSASVPANAAVITIEGVCAARPKPALAKAAAAKPATKTPAADCKTIITKAQFETLAKGLTPNMTPQIKRQLANLLPRLNAMSDEAKKKGLDRTPEFRAAVKFYEMQILAQQLQRKIQEDAAKIPDAKIEQYYKDNPEAYEQYDLDRLFVPRVKQPEPESKEEQEKDAKLTEDQRRAKEEAERAKTEASEQEMTKLADSLRARAAAGEDFVKLQKEAFEAAGMKIESPTVNLPKVRRTGLPPAHAAVFDLKAGDVSQVISDNGGHYIYKVVSKEVLPLDQVKEEIHNRLQSETVKEAMEKVNNSFKATTNEAYFGPPMPGGMGGPPPRRIPNPRMPQGPTQAPAPPQPPAAKPN